MIKTYRYSRHKGAIHTAVKQGKKRNKRSVLINTGDDPEEIKMCLNCTEPKCNGRCDKIRRTK